MKYNKLNIQAYALTALILVVILAIIAVIKYYPIIAFDILTCILGIFFITLLFNVCKYIITETFKQD